MDKNAEALLESGARKKILAGVNKAYNAVKLTLGPEGRNALLPRTFNRGPRITNDGITILENIQPKDEYERIALEAYKEGSKKTNELKGDGTTTTAVIAGSLVNQIFGELSHEEIPTVSLVGQKPKRKGVRALRLEMIEEKNKVIEEIKKVAKPIKTLADLEKIAIVSIGKEDEATAKSVAKMVWELGHDEKGYVEHHIDVTEGYKGEVETETIVGMRFPSKVAHREFTNRKERFEMEANELPILITNYKFDNALQAIAILNHLKVPKIAIFSPEFSNKVLASFIASRQNGAEIYPIKCPALRTEQMEDLAVYTGATVIDKDKERKLESITTADLGYAEKIVVKDTENREDAVLWGGRGEKVKRGSGTLITERQDMLKKQILESRNEVTKLSLERRIANLHSAVGVIRVGSSTSAEGLFIKLKVEDGVNACKSALKDGYVRGGGLCLKEIAEKLPESILTNALKAPYEQIQKNAGGSLEIGKDIIDPAGVVIAEVEHGVSVASILITTDILIPESRERSVYEGYETVAKAILRGVYFEAKHKGMLTDAEDDAAQSRENEFERVMMTDKG